MPGLQLFRFTVSELLREKQQRRGLKLPPPRLGLTLPVRYSSYVSPNIIISSMHIAIMIPYKPNTAKGGVLSLVNFIDHEDNPFGSTTNFKSFDPAKKT